MQQRNDTYAAELPSTVLNSEGSVDGHALDLLPEMFERFVIDTGIGKVD